MGKVICHILKKLRGIGVIALSTQRRPYIPSLCTGKLREGSLTALAGGPQGWDTPRGQRLAAGGQVREELDHPEEGRGAGALYCTVLYCTVLYRCGCPDTSSLGTMCSAGAGTGRISARCLKKFHPRVRHHGEGPY